MIDPVQLSSVISIPVIGTESSQYIGSDVSVAEVAVVKFFAIKVCSYIKTEREVETAEEDFSGSKKRHFSKYRLWRYQSTEGISSCRIES